MDRSQKPHRSHLFTLRLWPEAMADGQVEWRGQVRHLPSGETRYFREWPVLVAFVQNALPPLAGDQGRVPGTRPEGLGPGE
jgi:hypothetical protein